jgi:hypothetical protein
MMAAKAGDHFDLGAQWLGQNASDSEAQSQAKIRITKMDSPSCHDPVHRELNHVRHFPLDLVNLTKRLEDVVSGFVAAI